MSITAFNFQVNREVHFERWVPGQTGRASHEDSPKV